MQTETSIIEIQKPIKDLTKKNAIQYAQRGLSNNGYNLDTWLPKNKSNLNKGNGEEFARRNLYNNNSVSLVFQNKIDGDNLIVSVELK